MYGQFGVSHKSALQLTEFKTINKRTTFVIGKATTLFEPKKVAQKATKSCKWTFLYVGLLPFNACDSSSGPGVCRKHLRLQSRQRNSGQARKRKSNKESVEGLADVEQRESSKSLPDVRMSWYLKTVDLIRNRYCLLFTTTFFSSVLRTFLFYYRHETSRTRNLILQKYRYWYYTII